MPDSSQKRSESSADFKVDGNVILILALIAAMAVLAYLPAFAQSFIEDDYPNIIQAQVWGGGQRVGGCVESDFPTQVNQLPMAI